MFDTGIEFDLSRAQRCDISAAVGIKNIFWAFEEMSVGLAIVAEADHAMAKAFIDVECGATELAAVAANGNVHEPILAEVVTFPFISIAGSVGECKSKFHTAVFGQGSFALAVHSWLFLAETAGIETIFRNAESRQIFFYGF